MRYTYCERVIWHAMVPAICRYLASGHPDWDIRQLKKEARTRFRQMADRTPDIGTLRENSHRMNLTGGMVWLAFYQAAPEPMAEADFGAMARAAMSAPLVKASFSSKKDQMFTAQGAARRKAQLERNNLASDSSFNWRAEVVPGRDPSEHTVYFRRCGLCALGRQEGLPQLVPYMCDVDYLTYPWMGGALYRTKTLAGGGDCCDFYICQQGSRWDAERGGAAHD